MSIVARLEQERLDPTAESAKLAEHGDGAGAMVTFTGLARPLSSDGEQVDRLVLEHHPVLTEKSLQDIASAAAERFDVSHVHVVHRTGQIAPGEPIVFVGSVSAHRRAAFEAAEYLMDRLKTEAVLWKREDRGQGPAWIEPTREDYADLRRWE